MISISSAASSAAASSAASGSSGASRFASIASIHNLAGGPQRFSRIFTLATILPPLLLIGPPLSFAQGGRYAYLAQHQYTGTSGKSTLQLPTTATTSKVRGVELYVSCPTASCTVVITYGSGLATTTSATRYRLRSSTPATSKALFFTTSDATGGTTLPAIPLSAGEHTLAIDDIELLPGEAVSFTVASTSQTVTVIPKWEETI